MDAFTVTVKASPVVASSLGEAPVAKRYAALIARMYEWRNDPRYVSDKDHTDRWDRALLAFGETLSDTTLTPMTAAEAQVFADTDWGENWVPVAAAMWELENQMPMESAVTDLEVDATREVSLSGVFSDADGDVLTITATSSDETVATVSVASDGTSLTVAGVSDGTATITVTAQDSDGNRVSDTFDVAVIRTPEPEAVELPGPVFDLQLSVTADSLTVSWQAPEVGGAPKSYIVHLKPEGGGRGKTKTPKAKKLTVTFSNLEAGKTYRVWARAQNEAGKGERVHATITLPEE